jgi:hypothetical protein
VVLDITILLLLELLHYLLDWLTLIILLLLEVAAEDKIGELAEAPEVLSWDLFLYHHHNPLPSAPAADNKVMEALHHLDL